MPVTVPVAETVIGEAEPVTLPSRYCLLATLLVTGLTKL
jgi:hypothetical protein